MEQAKNLEYLGLYNPSQIYWNLSPALLTEKTILNGQGHLTSNGALSIDTGLFKGRSPLDRYIVKDHATETIVAWDSQYNFSFDSDRFDLLYTKLVNYFSDRDVYARDTFLCADIQSIRVITEYPWSNLFAYNMFIRPGDEELEDFKPEWHVICAPGFLADPSIDGTRQGNFSILNFIKKIAIIGGSGFTGEIKKGMFTVLNFVLPTEHSVFPMHCSANAGENNQTAIFFGLSGTGKTTLASDNNRKLIGDDEHGWGNDTIFNFEGGCYARTINLTREKEPQIYDAIRNGALLENIGFMQDGVTPNYFDCNKTENTRVSYPLHHVEERIDPSVGQIPTDIFFLTCDAYGVMPPIAKLSVGQARYYLLSGYSAKIPGSEVGVSEPTAIFSSCFGAPFLPLHPTKYAEMFGEKLRASKANVWLINTGWTGGPFGKGERIKLEYSRAIIDATLKRQLDSVKYTSNNIFGLSVPSTCPGIPENLLNPFMTWNNPQEYMQKAKELIAKFQLNFLKFREFADEQLLKAELKLE